MEVKSHLYSSNYKSLLTYWHRPSLLLFGRKHSKGLNWKRCRSLEILRFTISKGKNILPHFKWAAVIKYTVNIFMFLHLKFIWNLLQWNTMTNVILIKGSISLGALLQLQKWVYYHHGGEPGGRQVDIMLASLLTVLPTDLNLG